MGSGFGHAERSQDLTSRLAMYVVTATIMVLQLGDGVHRILADFHVTVARMGSQDPRNPVPNPKPKP